MVSVCHQALGWILSMGSWGATIGVLLSHKWKKNSLEGSSHSVLDSVTNMEGLWEFCQVYPTGQVQCWPFSGPLFSLPGIIVACRVLLMISILLGAIAGLLALFGFKSTQIGPQNEKGQVRLCMISGIMLLLCGICTTAASSAYIFAVLNEIPSLDPKGEEISSNLHEAVKISLAFGLFWTIGALLQLYGSRSKLQADNSFRFSSKKAAEEYV